VSPQDLRAVIRTQDLRQRAFPTIPPEAVGKLGLDPSRQHCPSGSLPATTDVQGRDTLEGFWRQKFGHSHDLLIADVFFDNIDVDGQHKDIAFTSSTAEPANRC